MTHHTGSDEGRLSEAEQGQIIRAAIEMPHVAPLLAAVERILAARAAAPDALRERVEALAADLERSARICNVGNTDTIAAQLRAALADPTDGATT